MFRLRERMIDDSRQRMRGLASDYSDGRISLSKWQREMRREIGRNFQAMRELGRGGPDWIQRGDRMATSEAVKRESQYVAGFARDIHDGKLTPEQMARRAEMYADAAYRREYDLGRLASHKENGYTHKRRVGPNDGKTCATCHDEIGRGWVPIDEPGFVLGRTECVFNDRCEIEYRLGGKD